MKRNLRKRGTATNNQSCVIAISSLSLPVRGRRGGGPLDEHGGPVPQPPGDLLVLLPALLPGPQDLHLALPRDAGGGAAGDGARVLRAADGLQGQRGQDGVLPGGAGRGTKNVAKCLSKCRKKHSGQAEFVSYIYSSVVASVRFLQFHEETTGYGAFGHK